MIDGAAILDRSRAGASKYVPGPYRHWVDDIAAETALIMLRRARRGQFGGGIWLRRSVLMAVHKYFGLPETSRNVEADHLAWDEGAYLAEPARLDDRALSLARLQRIWPDLTERERQAVTLYLADYNTTESAEKIGVTKTQVARLRKSVASKARGEPVAGQHRRFSVEQRIAMQEMRARGLTIHAIATHFRASYSAIATALRDHDKLREDYGVRLAQKVGRA